MRESIIQTMVNKFLTWLSKKSVTALYKRTHFWVFSWGLDENTDLYLMSEESYHDRHRFGLHEETYDRKTENNSEKPNNSKVSEKPTGSTRSKMEQVDKDINVRSKDKPQICDTCRYYNSNIPCGSTPSACKEADKFAEEFVDGLKKLKPKDEPQTEREGE